LDLAARTAIYGLVGENTGELSEYAKGGSEKYNAMVERIRKRLNLTTLQYQRLEDLVEAIGLPKEKLCTYCWDGSE
jgi:amidophosphoribosyltransferase